MDVLVIHNKLMVKNIFTVDATTKLAQKFTFDEFLNMSVIRQTKVKEKCKNFS